MKTTKGLRKRRRFNVKPISKEEFDRMSPAQKRVAIAKDVLARLKAKQFVERHAVYVIFSSGEICDQLELRHVLWADKKDRKKAVTLATSSAQKLLATEPCEVCAKGAVVMSLIANFNNATVEEASATRGDREKWKKIGLMKIFPDDMWRAIERAFDQNAIGWCGHKNWSLETVMKWLIKHDGNFPYNGYVYTTTGRRLARPNELAPSEPPDV